MPLWHNRRPDPAQTSNDASRDRKTTRDTKKSDRVVKREQQMERKPFEKGEERG